MYQMHDAHEHKVTIELLTWYAALTWRRIVDSEMVTSAVLNRQPAKRARTSQRYQVTE